MSSNEQKAIEARQEHQRAKEDRINRNMELAQQGVVFMDIEQTYIGENVQIGEGTLIYPSTIIEGDVSIGKDCTIGPASRIVDSKVGDGSQVQNSVIIESRIGRNTKIGPFAYLRPNSVVGDDCKVGDFVEIKNSNLGHGSKASHLSYIGDSDVGEGVNIGCGVVFVNYDGNKKHRSIVDDGAFIGCNVNLVSPIKVGEQAYIAAGSTVTSDVPAGALYVARAKGKALKDWVSRRGLLKKNK